MLSLFSPQTEHLLRATYPNATFSLTCSTHEIELICRDLQTITLADTVNTAIVTYDDQNQHLDVGDTIDIGDWIERNVVLEGLSPEVLQVINEVLADHEPSSPLEDPVREA